MRVASQLGKRRGARPGSAVEGHHRAVADFIDLSIMSCTETNKLDRITADGMSVRREVLKERDLLATG